MLPDVLADAVRRIDFYLTKSLFKDTYQGSQRTRILIVRAAMDDLREELETTAGEEDWTSR